MRFLTKLLLALTIPAFVPAEPYPPLATLDYSDSGASAWKECDSPRAIRGDAIRCGSVTVPLLAVDSRERHGCQNRRSCADDMPAASRLSLQQALSSGPVRYRIVKPGRYARAVAVVATKEGNLDLSCWQIRQGGADYFARWDRNQIIARSCGNPLHQGEGGSNS
jgi:endonuclease YncB( thermonuclease family)